MKKKKLRFSSNLILGMIVVTPIVIFGIIYAIFFTLSNWVYYVHKPTVPIQQEYLFKDNSDNIYYFSFGEIKQIYETSKSRFAQNFYNKFDDNVDIHFAVSSEDYLYIALKNWNTYESKSSFLKIDKDFNIVKIWDFSFLDSRVISMVECDDLIYALFETKSNGHFLYMVDFENDNFFQVKNNVDSFDVFEDNDIKINICLNEKYGSGYMSIFDKKMKLSQYGNTLYFDEKIFLEVSDKTLNFNVNGASYSFDKRDNEIGLYKNAYLIDNKIIFATLELFEDDSCGYGPGKPSYCICSYGKSFLYSFDIETKELTLLEQFKEKTFLVDYDLDGAKYYYDGKLYINGSYYRDCETIKEGEKEDHTGSSYFERSEIRYYYISFYEGEFYGI